MTKKQRTTIWFRFREALSGTLLRGLATPKSWCRLYPEPIENSKISQDYRKLAQLELLIAKCNYGLFSVILKYRGRLTCLLRFTVSHDSSL